jgi:hypothetical protein
MNAVDQFRHDHPETRQWSDNEIVEAILLRLSRTDPDRVKLAYHDRDGRPVFSVAKAVAR